MSILNCRLPLFLQSKPRLPLSSLTCLDSLRPGLLLSGAAAPSCASLADFTRALHQIFQHTSPGREAAHVLVTLKQGKRKVTDYEFRTLTAVSEWNATALADAFFQELSGIISFPWAYQRIWFSYRHKDRQEARGRTAGPRSPSNTDSASSATTVILCLFKIRLLIYWLL